MKTFLLSLILLVFSIESSAQFLKDFGQGLQYSTERKLQDKAIKEAENAIEDAIDNAIEESLENSNEEAESTSNNNQETKSTAQGFSKSTPAANYNFQHKAVMQIQTGKEAIDVTYLLSDNENYFGVEFNEEQMQGSYFGVFDADRETMFTFMESGGQKIRMGMNLHMDDTEASSDYQFTATGNVKSILGYTCEEYLLTGEDMTANVWITDDIDLKFPNKVFDGKQTKKNNQAWMNDMEGWAMEMIMVDTSSKKPQTITMKCISIEASKFTLNTTEYNSLGY